jgi:hypothetical protein
MTMDIILPIKKSTCKKIHFYESLLPLVILIVVVYTAVIVISSIVGGMAYYIIFERGVFISNMGYVFGFAIGCIIVTCMYLVDFEIIRFRCKGE